MRPLRLVLQAFGPYAEREDIHFDHALRAGVFGIYGPTGAGKSSIFNGIAFALFGETAKERLEGGGISVRSDHAPRDLPTVVEFVFDLGSKRYFLRRLPDQVRAKQRGSGTMVQKHEAYLFDATGMEVAEISADNPGKVIAEKKTNAVKAEVEALLGYGVEQFRQIVLLPQGKFETFLAANSEERLRILERLFDVSVYKAFAQTLRDEAQGFQATVKRKRELIQDKLQERKLDSEEALVASIAAAAENVAVVEQDAARHRAALTTAEHAKSAAEALAQKFANRDAAKVNLADIDGGQAENVARQTRLDQAKVAQSLADLDAAVFGGQARREQQKQAEQDSKTKLTQAEVEADAAAARLEAEQGRQGELTAARAELAELQRYGETLTQATAQQETLSVAVHDYTQAKSACADAESQVGHCQKRADDLEHAAAEARQRHAAHTQLQLRLRDAEAKHGAADAYAQAEKQLAAANHEQTQAKVAADIAEEEWHQADDRFVYADKALQRERALALATHLQAGAPCPVCGSTDHPHPARGTTGSADLVAELDVRREARDAARGAFDSAKARLDKAEGRRDVCQIALDALPKAEGSAAHLKSERDGLLAQIKALGKVVAPEEAEAAWQAARAELVQAQSAFTAAQSTLHTADMQRNTAQTALDAALATVPEDLRAFDALQARRSAVEAVIAQREGALQTAQQADADAREATAAATAALTAAQQAHQEAQTAAADLQQQWQNRLQVVNFTEPAYATCKLDIPQIPALLAMVEKYKSDVLAAQERLKQAEAEVAEQTPPDLVAITAAYDAATAVYREAEEARGRALAAHDELVRLQTSLADIAAEIEKAEAGFRVLGRVERACSGNSKAKTKLETFAIAVMFDRVLAAANLRLHPMTGGRYTLKRSEDMGVGRGKRGLEIEVFDVHTGRSRSPSTLSGGEMFTAALALALGLSDVVESVSGGIRLDTIFIDEGFGSLDQDALDQVLQKLQDLVGQNRAVGLISHVDLVQQTIPVGFQITKTTSGSHVAVRNG